MRGADAMTMNLDRIYVVGSARTRDVGAEWRANENAAEVFRAQRDKRLAMIAFLIAVQAIPFILLGVLLS